VPILLLAVGPWAVAAAAGLRHAWRSRPADGAVSPRRFLLVWCAVVFVFFSVSQSKLPAYLVPMVPALALLGGDALANGGLRRPGFALAAGVMVFGVLLFIINEFGEAQYVHLLEGTGEVFADWTESCAVLLVVASGIGLYWVDRTDSRRIVVGVLGACYVAMSLTMFGYGALAPLRSGVAFAKQIKRAGPAQAPVYAVRTYEQTLPFYLNRLVTVVDFAGELEPSIRDGSQNRVLSLEEFRARWLADAYAYAVMPVDTFEVLRGEGLPMDVVAEEPKRVLVRKPSG
jgi:4-amino-4-deoxy-L-arabinose transferase-like glycosyltransferase